LSISSVINSDLLKILLSSGKTDDISLLFINRLDDKGKSDFPIIVTEIPFFAKNDNGENEDKLSP
jgi:hypothetical protein